MQRSTPSDTPESLPGQPAHSWPPDSAFPLRNCSRMSLFLAQELLRMLQNHDTFLDPRSGPA